MSGRQERGRRRRKNRPIGPALLALVASSVFVLPGYDIARQDDGDPLHWPDRHVNVFLQAKGTSLVTVKQLETALTRVLGRFNSVQGSRLKLSYGGLVSADPGLDIYVRIGKSGFATRDGEVLGKIDIASDDDGTLKRVEVVLNDQDLDLATTPQFGKATADLEAVVGHMVGRAIGLSVTRDQDAQMYFLAATSRYRALSLDDARAVRFLYPATPFSDGRLCDACDGHDHCDGGFCATFTDGNKSFCTRSCEEHSDCPVGYSCGTWVSGKACFPNDLHCAPDLAKAPPSGPCASDLACDKELFCLGAATGGFCTAQCLGQCGPFGSCRQLQIGSQVVGLCIKGGGAVAGAPCEGAPDCGSMTCAPSLLSGGKCSQPCTKNSQCPAGFQCDGGSPTGYCVRKGTLAIGWPCLSGFDCETGLCAQSGGAFEQVCTRTCKVTTDCPEGTGCTPTKGGAICLPFGAPPAGSPCKNAGGCATGLVCDESDVPGAGVCRIKCNPFGDSKECTDGGRCAWVSTLVTATGGACRGGGGGGLTGVACSGTEPCRIDLACAGADPKTGLCRRNCDMNDKEACGAGQSCVALTTTAKDGIRRGVCGKETGPLNEHRPLRKPATKNFTGGALDMKDTVLPYGSIVKKADEPESGCSATRRSDGAAGLVGLILLAMLAICRRKTADRLVV